MKRFHTTIIFSLWRSHLCSEAFLSSPCIFVYRIWFFTGHPSLAVQQIYDHCKTESQQNRPPPSTFRIYQKVISRCLPSLGGGRGVFLFVPHVSLHKHNMLLQPLLPQTAVPQGPRLFSGVLCCFWPLDMTPFCTARISTSHSPGLHS